MIRNNSVHGKRLREIKQAVWNIPFCDEYHLVVLIESGFRPLIFRVAEYVWLVGLLSIGSRRAMSLTIGRNQLRYDQWLSFLKTADGDSGLISVLHSCEQVRTARSAARWYLNLRGYDGDTRKSVSRLYTGRTNHYYDQLFSESRKFLQRRLMPFLGTDDSSSRKYRSIAKESFLTNLIWLLSLPFFFASWICFRYNFLHVRNDLTRCRSILGRHSREQISDELYDVLRLAEDHRNALHFGIDPIAISRAFWRNSTRKGLEGASTIEQQFVRSCTGQYERTLKRKFREQVVAIKVSRIATKREICAAFIWTAHYGDLCSGPLSILSRFGCFPSDARFLESAELVARIKFPEPSPTSTEWKGLSETRVRYLLNLSMSLSGERRDRNRRAFQTLYLSGPN